MYCRPGWRAAIAAAVLFAGCSSQSSRPQGERIAFLRLENLGQDQSADWIGRAIPIVLDAELAGVSNLNVANSSRIHALDRAFGVRPISAPGISAERVAALAEGANRLAYGDYWTRGGKLFVRVWVEDPQAGRILRTFEISAPAGDVIGAATQIARQFSPRPAAFSTSSNAALRDTALSMEAKDLPQAIAASEEALAADPKFGPAYRTLAELYLQKQDRDAAKAVLARGLRQEGLPPLEHARIAVDAASLEGDAAARQQSLAALAKLEPGNARTWESLAQVATTRHDYAASVEAYKKALEIEPANTSLLNESAYADVYAGHFEDGVAAIKRYRALRPKDANALDSFGDINLLTNRYQEAAAAYSDATKTDPNFNGNCDLYKAAMARAMSGDLAGADALFGQYIAARTLAHDPAAPLLHSEWLWLTGRRKQGAAEMLAFAHTAESHQDVGTASRAYSGMALWSLMAGDRPGAQEMAQKAVAAAGQKPSAAVVIARFLAQPSASVEEWQSRVARLAPNPAQTTVRDQMLAFALLLDGQFEAAKAPLQHLYDVTGTAGYEGITVLLAWCDVETGKFQDADPLLALTPVPPTNGLDTFMPLWFPRLFQLRAEVARKSGKAAGANQNQELFEKLSGR